VLNYFRSKWAKVPHIEGRLEVFALDASMGSVLGPNLLQPPRTALVGSSRLPPPLPPSPSAHAHASAAGSDASVHQLHYRLIPLLPFGGAVGNVDRTFGDLMLQMLLNRNGPGGGAADSFGQLLLSPAPLVDSDAVATANGQQLVPPMQTNSSAVRGVTPASSIPLSAALSSVATGAKRRRDGSKAKPSNANAQSPVLEAPLFRSEPAHAYECMEAPISDNTIDFLFNSFVASNNGSQCRVPDGDAPGAGAAERPASMSENTMDNILLSIIADGTMQPSAASSLLQGGPVYASHEVHRSATAHAVMHNAESSGSEAEHKRSRTEAQYGKSSSSFPVPTTSSSSTQTSARSPAAAPAPVEVGGAGVGYPVLIGIWERARASGRRHPPKRVVPHRIGNPGDSTLFLSKSFLE
jgi:hypothetical protein